MKKRELALFILVITIASILFMGDEVYLIPYYIFRSLFRMIGAYVLTLIFSISFGILIAHNKTAFKVLFPVMDILQSVPILGFLPFAMLYLIGIFPGYGTEVVSIFLIFTSMTWAVLFNVIEGIHKIPESIKDVAKMTNLNKINYLFQVVFPSIYGPIVSGSISGWGGAWYFLVVGEYLTFANKIYSLEGIGSFISKSAFGGHIVYSLLGVGILAAVVLSINKFVWQPLLFRAKKYSYGNQKEELYNERGLIVEKLEESYGKYIKFPITKSKPLSKITEIVFSFFSIGPEYKRVNENKLSISFMVLVTIIITFLIFEILFGGSTIVNFDMLGLATLFTIIRILIAYILALVWTLGLAIFIAKRDALLKYLMPIFDVGQSVPAVAVFPMIIIFVIKFLGVGIGVEVASILLIMTGTQWYLLFNLIRAIREIPQEMFDVSEMLSLDKLTRAREIIIPAIIPALIVGSIEAIGGAFNATIISEYIIYKDSVFSTIGLGYLMSKGAVIGDNAAILISVGTMMLIVLIVNKFVWKKMLHSIGKYKSGV